MNSLQIVPFLLFVFIPVFISFMFIPYWTRRTESFGVSIPEAVYDEPLLKLMRKRYALLSGILSMITILIFLLAAGQLSMDEQTLSIVILGTVGFYMLGGFAIYLKFHFGMKRLKSEKAWNKEKSQQVWVDTTFRDARPTYSNLWFIIPFFIAVGTLLWTIQLYEQIPQRIPMKYNFEGDVTNWADKSYRTVMIMPVMQIYLTLLFLFVNVIISRAKQQISAEQPERSKKQNLIFRRRWSAFIIITGTALTAMFSLIQVANVYPVNQQVLVAVPLIFSIGVLIASILISITTGQGGSRVRTHGGGESAVIDRDDDHYWKLGQLYFNKNDPAIFLEKRFGVGWTVNLARPVAWVVFIVIILLAAGIPFLLGA
ncbi:DUF1648 domain-containing protein [Jeotgalibacillus sp. S-D1]|uniref:DUF1648 domain-containing protein n=1 Tax=Jeotgalibacillus sp. S-D1 TaxID=2552189 RepID=UPI00105A5D22|nr:DUF5808 domain-containing protein [Jeotgalibacillus sp. S-D1]TDL33016.1 DUF1648 domain-containing protein [Jeotgalibacillus sp. S-D1]